MTIEPMPVLLKAGDKRVLLNGTPPHEDCRVVAEELWQEIQNELRSNEKELDETKVKETFSELALLQQENQELKIQLASKSLGSDVDRILEQGRMIERAEKAEAENEKLKDEVERLKSQSTMCGLTPDEIFDLKHQVPDLQAEARVKELENLSERRVQRPTKTAEEELKEMTIRFWDQVEITEKLIERVKGLEDVIGRPNKLHRSNGGYQPLPTYGNASKNPPKEM